MRWWPRLPRVARLRLRPDDVLVVRCEDRTMTSEEAARLHDQVARAFPDNRIVILAPGLSLEVVSPEPRALSPTRVGPLTWTRPTEHAGSDETPPPPPLPASSSGGGQ